MPVKRTSNYNLRREKQRGAALMIMLIIIIVGVAAIFVSSLNSSALNIERDKVTADALAQAKDTLIGYAVSDPNRPGELPCPDYNDDGMITITDDYSGSDCKSLIGRLPWKKLGLPDLRDGSGERLWYALSDPFHANGANVLNSDTTGDLTVSGSTMASNVIAIVFAPGSVLSGKSRSTTQTAPCTTTSTPLAENLCASNYLEGSNANLNQPVTPNTNYQTAAASATFNDQAILITHDQLFPGVEMRIAREAKSCLDDYAQTPPPPTPPSGKYPWAAPVNDLTYTSTANIFFGRLPITPFNIDPSVAAVINAVAPLQLALNTYSANTNASTATALSEAGLVLINAAENAQNINPPPLSNSIINHLNQTGDQAIKLANNQGGLTVADIQLEIDTANSNLNAAAGTVDPSMSPVWPPGCIITTATYWNFWKNLVFYQVASGYQPGGSASCTLNTTCLKITGSGNTAGGPGSYRAAVLVARREIAVGTPPVLQNRTNPATNIATNPPTPYLEGINAHTGITPATSFETYNPSDPNYATVNDLVLCLDKKNYCK